MACGDEGRLRHVYHASLHMRGESNTLHTTLHMTLHMTLQTTPHNTPQTTPHTTLHTTLHMTFQRSAQRRHGNRTRGRKRTEQVLPEESRGVVVRRELRRPCTETAQRARQV